jgi:hypothetical protein
MRGRFAVPGNDGYDPLEATSAPPARFRLLMSLLLADIHQNHTSLISLKNFRAAGGPCVCHAWPAANAHSDRSAYGSRLSFRESPTHGGRSGRQVMDLTKFITVIN